MSVSHWEVRGKYMTDGIVVVAYDLSLCPFLFLIICLGMCFFQVEEALLHSSNLYFFCLGSYSKSLWFCFRRDAIRLAVLARVAMAIPGHNYAVSSN